MIEIRTHGRGGQGVVTLGEVVAECGLKLGKYSQTLPFFGVERRGANIKSTLRIDDKPIRKRSMSYTPDIIILFNEAQYDIARMEGYKEDTKWLVNVPLSHQPEDGTYQIDANKIAVDFDIKKGDDYFINLIMAGALMKMLKMDKSLLIDEISQKMKVPVDHKLVKSAEYAYDTVKVIGGSN